MRHHGHEPFVGKALRRARGLKSRFDLGALLRRQPRSSSLYRIACDVKSAFLAHIALPILALASAAGAAAEAPAPEAPMSYADARARFHAASDQFRADDAAVARDEARAESARSLSGPKVSFSAMRLEGSKSLDLNLSVPNPIAGVPGLPSSIRLGYDDKIDLSGYRTILSFVWPIYTGGAISAEQEALSHHAAQTRWERDARRDAEDGDLALRYWGVQLARSVEAMRAQAALDEEAELHRAQAMEQKGVISRMERLSVEVSRDRAKREALRAQTDRRVAETEFLRRLRMTTLPALMNPLFIVRGDLGSLASWQAKAEADSPALKRLESLELEARAGVKAAQSAYAPQVFAFGMKNLTKHDLTLPEPDWLAGVGVEITLWSNRDRASSVAAARSLETQAGASRAEARTTLRRAVEVAWLRAHEARERYDEIRSSVTLAEENLKMRELAFGRGLSKALDVSHARTELVGAQVALQGAAYEFVAAWATLHAAANAMPEFESSIGRAERAPAAEAASALPQLQKVKTP